MPRSRTSDGRRVNRTARLSEAEASAFDAMVADSGYTASEWLRRKILKAIAERDTPRTFAGIPVLADDRMPAGTAALVGPDRDGKLQVQPFPAAVLLPGEEVGPAPRRKREREQCPHRNWGRYCGGCGRAIGKDGYPASG